MEKEKLDHRVVYLGPPVSHTHLAYFKYFGVSNCALPKESIQEVFETVERREVDYGVVPVENSIEGSVNRTLDLFIGSEVKICGEILICISHDLLSKTGNPRDIKKILSHPQALEQCREWLRKNFPHVEKVETASTSKAAQMVTQDRKTAAIASSLAAHFYGLRIIQSQIEDYFHNYTRFFIISQEIGNRTGKDKTSLLFSVSHTPGSLCRVLKIFSEKGINLTKIESRPMKGKPWEYIFFLDIEGHTTDSQIDQALDQMKAHVLLLKILGSYPQNSQGK